MALFREIVMRAKPKYDALDYATLCHNFLATLEQDEFNQIFFPISHDPDAKQACTVLACLESLPDRHLWAGLLEVECGEIKFEHLAKGVVSTLDHKSQEATDVRWVKVFLAILSGKAVVPPDFVVEVAEYPNKGDIAQCAPHDKSTRDGSSECRSRF